MNSDTIILTRAYIFFKRLHTECMKRIKFTLICTAALMLAIPFAGCGRGDAGNAAKSGVEQHVETLTEENKENEGCPDGDCDKLPEDNDGNGNDCPDGKCPARPLPPRGRHGRGRNGHGRVEPLPCPHKGD